MIVDRAKMPEWARRFGANVYILAGRAVLGDGTMIAIEPAPGGVGWAREHIFFHDGSLQKGALGPDHEREGAWHYSPRTGRDYQLWWLHGMASTKAEYLRAVKNQKTP